MFGHIYNPNERRIGIKQHVWDLIKDGQLMNVTMDTEGSGAGRGNRGYSTPNYEFFSEIGTARFDFAGNYLDSFQIFPRAPEWLAFEPGSPLIQRLVTQPELFDDEERIGYWNAMAYTLDYLDQSSFAYSRFGDKRVPVNFQDYNPQFKAGTDSAEKDGRGIFKPASEMVIPIKLLDEETGNYVEDVRYHPDRQIVARRIDENPESPFYETRGKNFYYDENTQSIWKYVPAARQDSFFNAAYDWPRLRSNFYRTGMPSMNTGFMNSRATALNFQRPKNTVTDVMHMAQMAALHGPKGENGFDFPRYVDPQTGKINHRLTLSEYIDFHAGQANPLRFVKPGTFMPDDGSKHDDIFDHGAVLDSVGTGALANIIWDRAPWVMGNYYKQRHNRRIYDFLGRKDPKGSSWNLFSLAERDKGGKPYDGLYYFIGNDDTAGKMKKLIFLRCDGHLHDHKFAKFGDKHLHELSVDELDQLMDDRDGPIRIETENYFPGATHLDDVLEKSPRGQALRAGNTADIGEDYNYITANEQMERNIIAAISRRAMRFKFGNGALDVKLMEDELNQLYAAEVPFIVSNDTIAEVTEKGPRSLPDIVQKIHKDLNDVLTKDLRNKDDALMQMMAQANPVDNFADYDIDDAVHRERDENGQPTEIASEAARALSGYTELCQRLYNTKFKKKGWAYKEILDSIKNPHTGEPFIEKGKFKFATVREAFEFRQQLCLRFMSDMDTEIKKAHSSVAAGYVTRDFDAKPDHKRAQHLLLIAEPNNGQDGNLPQIIDTKTGAVLDYDYVYRQDFGDVKAQLDRGAWQYRFHRMTSEPSALRVAHRFVDMGLEDQLPETFKELYVRDFLYRMKGFANEPVTESRMTTLETMAYDLNHDKKLQQQAQENEEGQKILDLVHKWVARKQEQVKARQKQFPHLITGFEPDTDVPLDHIDHEVRRDPNVPFTEDPNFIVLDLPLEVIHQPIEQDDVRLPARGLIIRDLDAKTRTKISKGKPVLVRTPQGQIFATGKASIDTLKNPEDAALSTIMKKARNDYDEAGAPLTERDKLYYLGIENLYPLAATRDIDWGLQTFDMPFNQYYGTFAPDFARAPKGRSLRAAFIPEAYCPQVILPGDIRFREVEGKMFSQIDGEKGRPTGHITETKLTDIWGVDKDTGHKQGIPLGKLIDMIKAGDVPEKVIKDAGFLGGEQIERHLQENLTAKKFRGNPMDEPILIAQWKEVNKAYMDKGQDESLNRMAFIQADNHAPRAALMRFGRPVYPSEYRPLLKKAL
jgi:hypothetical protein